MLTTLVPLEMCPSYIFGDYFDVTWLGSEMEVDTADYPGLIQAYFEVICVGYPGDVALVDSGGNEMCRLTFAYTGTSDFERKRTAFTLNSGVDTYYLKTFGADEAGVFFRHARIILEVQDSARLRVQLHMVDGDQSAGGPYGDDEAYDNINAFQLSISGNPYSYGGSAGEDPWQFRAFLKTEANWQTVDHWTFEVIGASYPGYPSAWRAAVFNRTTGLMVAGTEIVFDDDINVPTRKTIDFANDAVNFTDGEEFDVRFQLDSGDWGLVDRAALYAVLDPAVKCEIHWLICYSEGSWYGSQFPASRYLHEPTKYEAGSLWYFENTGVEWGDGSAYALLQDLGTDDSGSAGAFGYGTTAAVITNGSGLGWIDPNKVLTYNNDPTVVDLHIAAETATLRVSGFSLVVPGGAPNLKVGCSIACMVGPPGGLNSAYFSAKYQGETRSKLYTQAMASWSWDPILSEWTGNQFGATFQFTTATSVNDPIDLIATQPGNTNPTWFYWDYVYQWATWGLPTAELNFPVGVGDTWEIVGTRDRTADISADLVDGDRYMREDVEDINLGTVAWYAASFLIAVVTGSAPLIPAECVSATAAIDSSTLLITGTGVGLNATQWRVIRVSDGAVMDSGAGDTASFSFTGAYDVVYQLQFGSVVP